MESWGGGSCSEEVGVEAEGSGILSQCPEAGQRHGEPQGEGVRGHLLLNYSQRHITAHRKINKPSQIGHTLITYQGHWLPTIETHTHAHTYICWRTYTFVAGD